MPKGLIVKALSGFYYVSTDDGDCVTCRARGVFRYDDTSPMVGDRVTIEPTEDGNGSVVAIDERRNSLLRPPVANLDRLVMVVSCAQPAPNALVIDKLTAIAAHRSIAVELVFSKTDLADPEPYSDIYRGAGYPVHLVNNLTGDGVLPLREQFGCGLSVFCGNSGAGKSSLLNALFPELSIATGGISHKLGRGRHTTRHVELYDTGLGGYIADTPGFSAVDFLQLERMSADQLELCFPEFGELPQQCRYTGCSHVAERDCAVRQAVAEGRISDSRWQSYCTIYNELRQVKSWEL